MGLSLVCAGPRGGVLSSRCGRVVRFCLGPSQSEEATSWARAVSEDESGTGNAGGGSGGGGRFAG
jgi:hypothetical protein